MQSFLNQPKKKIHLKLCYPLSGKILANLLLGKFIFSKSHDKHDFL